MKWNQMVPDGYPGVKERLAQMKRSDDSWDFIRYPLYTLWLLLAGGVVWGTLEAAWKQLLAFWEWLTKLDAGSPGLVLLSLTLTLLTAGVLLIAKEIGRRSSNRVIAVVEIGAGLGLSVQGVQKLVEQNEPWMLAGFLAGILMVVGGFERIRKSVRTSSKLGSL